MSEGTELLILLTAKDAASKVVEGLGAKFGALGAAGKLAAAGVAAIATAGVALVGGLTKLAQEAASAAGDVAKLKRETGLSAVEASKFVAIGKRFSLGVDDLSKSFGIFSKNLETNAAAIVDNNIKVIRAKDGHIDFEKTLGDVAERFAHLPDGVEKTTLAMELFGKSGKDMIPFLNQGKAGLKDLGDEAARVGLVFDDKALAAAKRYTQSQKDLSENVEGLKNKIGVAFLPILADVSTGFVKLADIILPPVAAGFDKVTGFVHTALGVFQDIKAAASFKMEGGGDFLGSIIGPKAAADFMERVSGVSAEWQTMWVFKIRPAIEWAEDHIPKFWDAFKSAIETAWTAAKPKLQELVDKAEDLKTKFEHLPPAVQKWAEATAAGIAVVKVTGLGDIIQGWANAIGNFVGGGAGAVAALAALGVSVAAAVAAFAILAAGIGAVIFVGTHLDDLDAAWTALTGSIRLLFAAWIDALLRDTQLFLNNMTDKINGVIDVLNVLWTKLGQPPLPHIEIRIHGADNVEKTLADLARERTVNMFIHAIPPQSPFGVGMYANGTDRIVTAPHLFIAGEAGPERVTVTPLGRGRGGGGGGFSIGQVVIHGNVDSQDRVEELGREFGRRVRLLGLAPS